MSKLRKNEEYWEKEKRREKKRKRIVRRDPKIREIAANYMRKKREDPLYRAHENILKLYNHFEDDISIYLILEFAPGG